MAGNNTKRSSVTVNLPSEPSQADARCARALLRVLAKAYEEQTDDNARFGLEHSQEPGDLWGRLTPSLPSCREHLPSVITDPPEGGNRDDFPRRR